jgi:hypothetical protein
MIHRRLALALLFVMLGFVASATTGASTGLAGSMVDSVTAAFAYDGPGPSIYDYDRASPLRQDLQSLATTCFAATTTVRIPLSRDCAPRCDSLRCLTPSRPFWRKNTADGLFGIACDCMARSVASVWRSSEKSDLDALTATARRRAAPAAKSMLFTAGLTVSLRALAKYPHRVRVAPSPRPGLDGHRPVRFRSQLFADERRVVHETFDGGNGLLFGGVSRRLSLADEIGEHTRGGDLPRFADYAEPDEPAASHACGQPPARPE